MFRKVLLVSAVLLASLGVVAAARADHCHYGHGHYHGYHASAYYGAPAPAYYGGYHGGYAAPVVVRSYAPDYRPAYYAPAYPSYGYGAYRGGRGGVSFSIGF